MYKLKRQLVDAVHKRKWKGPEEGRSRNDKQPKICELLQRAERKDKNMAPLELFLMSCP